MWNFSKKAITMIAVLSGLSLLCGCEEASIDKKQIQTGDIYIGANKVYEEKNETKNEVELKIEPEIKPVTETKTEPEPETEPVYLNSMKPVENSSSFHDDRESATDIIGNTYDNILIIGKSKID